MTTSPIATIGRVEIDPAIRRHRFVREALAIARLFTKKNDGERVIGTRNDQKSPECQLYGWGKQVPEHTDNTGWIYFVPLLGRPSITCAGGHAVLASNGDVCRMNDFEPHFTYDDTARVCLFIGPYERPADDVALAALTDGLRKLASGAYEAPRVRDGFRVVMSDECYAIVDDMGELMLIADAEARGYTIALCGQCSRRAVKLDPHFPWDWSMNVCSHHLTKRAAA